MALQSSLLQRLREQRNEHGNPQLSATPVHLYYLLSAQQNRLQVRCVVARCAPNGRLEAMQSLQIQPTHLHQPPPFIHLQDRPVLGHILDLAPAEKASDGWIIEGWHAPQLADLFATGRVRVATDPDCGVSILPDRAAQPLWTVNALAEQQLVLDLPDGYQVLATGQLYWQQHPPGLGRLVGNFSPRALALLENGPVVSADRIDDFRQHYAAEFHQLELPLPTCFRRIPAQARLLPGVQFFSVEGQDRMQFRFHYQIVEDNYRVELVDCRIEQDDYQFGQNSYQIERHGSYEVIVAPQDTSAVQCWFEAPFIRTLQRDLAAEQALYEALLATLSDLSAQTLAADLWTFASREAWQTLFLDWLPQKRRQCWLIGIKPDFQHHFVAAGDIQIQLDVLDKGWFDLAPDILVDGEKVPLLPLLLQCARLFTLSELAGLPDDHRIALPLDDGRQILVAAGRLLRWLSVLIELTDAQLTCVTQLRLPISQLGRLAALAEEQTRWQGHTWLQERAVALSQRPRQAVLQLPEDFRAALRPYQALGVAWLQQCSEWQSGAILADDMGLGKTVQALAHLVLQQATGALSPPALVVAPTSLLGNWAQEASHFAPSLRCLVLHGSERMALLSSLADYDLLVTSYGTLLRDQAFWHQQHLRVVILDEAQQIKNPATRISHCVKQLQADYRLCLTGTPVENHLGELWSLFDFIMPGLLGMQNQFLRHYVRNDKSAQPERAAGDVRYAALLQRVSPYMLRRRKQEVAQDLPPKTEICVRLALTETQADLYEAVRETCLQELHASQADSQVSPVLILNALTKLRQVCCDPALVDNGQTLGRQHSAKRDYLMGMVEELVDEGRSVLIFSQFTRMLELLAGDLQSLEIGFSLLTGKTCDRSEQVARFQAGNVPVFLISLKAGGTGLNLTRADTVIHFDPWWNSAAEQQATDRAHRIGQDKPVFVYKLIAERTVEERILALQQQKHQLLEVLYQAAEQTATQWSLDNATLLALLENGAPLN
jgi:superfamily II DNA or RNA helicase